MLQSVTFDTEKFIRLMMKMFEAFYNFKENKLDDTRRLFLNAVIHTLKLKPDKNNFISLSEVAANYRGLAEARKKFLAEHSTFLENFLVNELFQGIYPWHYHHRPTRSLSVFVVSYKVFELIIFSSTLKGCDKREDLLNMVDWFTRKIDHQSELQNKILELFKDDENLLALIESLLEG